MVIFHSYVSLPEGNVFSVWCEFRRVRNSIHHRSCGSLSDPYLMGNFATEETLPVHQWCPKMGAPNWSFYLFLIIIPFRLNTPFPWRVLNIESGTLWGHHFYCVLPWWGTSLWILEGRDCLGPSNARTRILVIRSVLLWCNASVFWVVGEPWCAQCAK